MDSALFTTDRVGRTTLLALALVVVFAAWLRLHNLGLPGLERNQDEDIMAIAVIGITEHGYPLMPSGMIYLRSGPLLYLMAGSAELFGLDEFSLRLVPAIFGILLVPLGFVVASRCFGRQYAIAVAILIAVSLWQVEVSRTARMYAPFAFFYILSAYGICRGWIGNVAAWRWLSIPLAILTITFHTLGFTLGAVFALAAVLPRQTLGLRALALAGAGLTGLAYIIWDTFESPFFVRAKTLIEGSGDVDLQQQAASDSTSFLSEAFTLLYEPPDPLFLSGTGAVYVWLILASLGCTIFLAYALRRWPAYQRPLPRLLLSLCLLAAILHQFTLVALLFTGLVFSQQRGLRASVEVQTLASAAVLAFLFVTWLLLGISGMAIPDATVHSTLRSLLDYPRFEAIRPFVIDRPVLTLLAGIGVISALHYASVERRMSSAAFLALTMVVALVLHGVFGSQFRERYNFDLDLLFLIFVVVGSVAGIRALHGYRQRFSVHAVNRASPRLINAMIGGALVVAILLDVRAWASPAYTAYWAGSSPAYAERFGFDPPVDRRSPARYVAQNLEEGDKVMSMDWLTSYVYVRQVDYWIRTTKYDWQVYRDGDTLRDLYLGAALVPDAQSLRTVIESPCRATLWLISSAYIIRHESKVSPEIMDMLETMKPYRAHIGLDGISAAYRIHSRHDC